MNPIELSQTLGPIDLTQAEDQTLRRYQAAGLW